MSTPGPNTPCQGSYLGWHVNEAVHDMYNPSPGRELQRRAQHRYYMTKIQPILETVFASSTIPIEILAKPIQDWNNRSVLEMAIKTMDQIFFGGEPWYSLDVDLGPLSPESRAQCSLRVRDGKKRIFIEISRNEVKSEQDFRALLIHEMAHGHILLHRCYCGSAQCSVRAAKLRQVGRGGHGWYWQRLVETAENLIFDLWGTWMDLGRQHSAIHELLLGEGHEKCGFLAGAFEGRLAGTLYKHLEDIRHGFLDPLLRTPLDD